MALNYPSINGLRYDWSSVEIKVNGKLFLGVREISYKHTLEPGEVFGTHAQVLGRTRGQYKAEGSITLYTLEWRELLQTLGAGYLEKSFDIAVAYAEKTETRTITDRLRGCRIKTSDSSHTQGSDPLIVKADLHIMYILEDGKSPLSNLKR